MSAQFAGVSWHKSSRSNGNGGNNCVEVAVVASAVGVRDSKNPDGPVLRFDPAAWQSFVSDAKLGNFDVTS
ncbi:DUF397 domain-containing protein [Dactylosporangium aurantiacum]|uniref:DUF397 domain-containing protein n=1 Tax=Dactylosporangium aurantiacum TaxID=35754 RepID=UPI000AB1D938|nr:DUF397 domain-containing protein [Dactylosporangium aurantiacum]MDG6107927.1 DUF397 domain-containing protein [Dactylosporangium aurantiacum]